MKKRLDSFINSSIILSIIFGVLVLGIITVAFIIPAVTEPENVTIPNCQGLKVSQCEKKLHNQDFVYINYVF